MQFSVRSLMLLTAMVAVVLAVGKLVCEAARQLGASDYAVLAWLGGLTALAVTVALTFVFANR